MAGQTKRAVGRAQAPTSAERGREHLSAGYREQMTVAQETVRRFGHTPGPVDGIMDFETASALRALPATARTPNHGRANPETLAALGIKDRLSRRAR